MHIPTDPHAPVSALLLAVRSTVLAQDPQQGGAEPAPISRDDQMQGGGAQSGGAGGDTGSGTVQNTPRATPKSFQDSCLEQLPFLLVMVAIFYFLLIRPQQQQEKKRKEMLSAIKKGDRVVTNGGLHGVVDRLEEATVRLDIGGGTIVTVDRAAVGRVERDQPAETGDGGKD